MTQFVRRFLLSLATVAFLVASPVQLQAQSDLGGALGKIGKTYADGYVQPVSDAFGADINSGLFRSADVGSGFIPGLPFDVYVGVSASGMFISDSQESFAFEGEEIQQQGRTLTVTAQGSNGNRVPTVFGDQNSDAMLEFRDKQTGVLVDQRQVPQGLLDAPLAPLPIPQVKVGTVAGTDAQLRYLPKRDVGDLGSVGFTGFALRHDVDQWIPVPMPLNLAVQGAWNQLLLEDDGGNELLDASGWAFNAQASKSVPVLPITIYSGVQYENFGVDYSYTLSTPGGGEQDISLSQDAETNVRALAGVTLSILIVQINADYAISNGSNILTAGVGLRL